jgi:hypothetical protein
VGSKPRRGARRRERVRILGFAEFGNLLADREEVEENCDDKGRREETVGVGVGVGLRMEEVKQCVRGGSWE